MKLKFKNTIVVLSSLLLLTGCVKEATKVKLVRLNADDVDSFAITTNLEETKEIHTAQQKEYLSYDGEYVSIPEANYPDGTKHLSDPNPVNLAWDFINIFGIYTNNKSIRMICRRVFNIYI